MLKILVLHGPNMNLLGKREPALYGHRDFAALCDCIRTWAAELDMEVTLYQSNHEGDLVDKIQEADGQYDGILINAAAYSHTSVAILDALKAVGLPTAEVHLTDIQSREPFRRFSYVSQYAFVTVTGKGFEGYRIALEEMKKKLSGE